jgi:hypothetical protein
LITPDSGAVFGRLSLFRRTLQDYDSNDAMEGETP